MATLHDLLSASAARVPERPAVIDAKRALTYAELDAASDAVARALVAAGVVPGQPVGIALPRTCDAVAGAYGILKAGACYVPLDPFAPAARSLAIAKNVGMTHLIAGADRRDNLVAPLQAAGVCESVLDPAAVPAADASLPAADGGALAYILHTSGSTGTPKGVAHTHASALAFVTMATRYFGITETDRLSGVAPLHFDLSVFDLYCAADAGAAVVLMPEYYGAFPKKMAQAIEAQGLTVWNSVVSALALMADRGKLDAVDASALRCVVFSGELMPARLLRRLRALWPHAGLYNVYGQTEANSSMVYPIGDIPDDDGWRVPIGQPFPGFEVFTRDDELYVRAGSVALGYHGDAARTADKFVEPGVYRTGDMVRVDDEGNYVFTGRTDNLIKSRGYRIELGDIELALASCPGVDRVAAVAVPDDVIGNRIYGFVTPGTVDRAAVLAHLADRLPKYMIPDPIEVRDELPSTSTGKVDRAALVPQEP